MLGLTLRQEFQGKRLKGTAIELANEKRSGATQVPAAHFLEITYPSVDLRKALEAVGPKQGRPVALIGERGQGKSHLLGALHHALTDAGATRAWLSTWAERLNAPRLAQLELRSGMHVISESLHRQRFKYLWDLLFEKHPKGPYFRGRWEAMGAARTPVPPDSLIEELLEAQPTALILDEFQTWFDGLPSTRQAPAQVWAFNFIQILSEIAQRSPELLTLVVSVRNGSTDAYRQLHRINPVKVDFKGPGADRDRRRLLLHRLFENRVHLSEADIDRLLRVHLSEFLRLMEVPPAEHEHCRRDFVEAWPFAPHLLQLLEDQVLVATDAQETRDLIRILADLYKAHGDKRPIITAADFRLDDQATEVASLLASVTGPQHASLRERAQRNLTAVQEAARSASLTLPHAPELIGALWLRSLAMGNMAGAEPRTLHVDITRDRPTDDNAFKVELDAVVDNSFNIHQTGERLLFREEENPRAKLMAYARNDRLFTDGSDRRQLAAEVRYALMGKGDLARSFRVLVLPPAWTEEPWATPELAEPPDQWDDRLPLLVLPEDVEDLDRQLGIFLKRHVPRRRNTVRFLLPKAGSTDAFLDRDLLTLARAVLKAAEWKAESPEYGKLHRTFQGELQGFLQERFDRFAILDTWSFESPEKCRFLVESVKAKGDKVPEAIEQRIRNDLFEPEALEELVVEAARQHKSLGDLLRELREPQALRDPLK